MQATAETAPFQPRQLDALMAMAVTATDARYALQRQALDDGATPAR